LLSIVWKTIPQVSVRRFFHCLGNFILQWRTPCRCPRRRRGEGSYVTSHETFLAEKKTADSDRIAGAVRTIQCSPLLRAENDIMTKEDVLMFLRWGTRC
jgi:hypothetical protein